MVPSQRGALTIIRAWFGNAVDTLSDVLRVHLRRVGTCLTAPYSSSCRSLQHKPEKPPKRHPLILLAYYPNIPKVKAIGVRLCMHARVDFHGLINNFWTFKRRWICVNNSNVAVGGESGKTSSNRDRLASLSVTCHLHPLTVYWLGQRVSWLRNHGRTIRDHTTKFLAPHVQYIRKLHCHFTLATT